jgi:hypothetical protein
MVESVPKSVLAVFFLRVLSKIKLTLNKATKKPQIKWLVIVRRRVNVVRLELNLVVAKWCGAVSICVFISVKICGFFVALFNVNFILLNTLRKKTANTDLGTLSTIDADDGDTFTYILENNSMAYFAVDGNMLKL